MNSEQQKLKKAALLKLAVRTRGVNVLDKIEGVGSIIKEDVHGLYQISPDSHMIKEVRPNEIVFYKGITTKLVYNTSSIFSLKRESDSNYYLYSVHSSEPLTQVMFSRRPEHYGLKTSRGTPMKNIGQVMGADCLAIAVDKQCSYFEKGNFCKYCNINSTNLRSKIPRRSSLEDIAELVQCAGKKFRFFDLTGGTFEDRDLECKLYIAIGEVIRDNLKKNTFGGPFSLSPPNNLNLLEKLKETNVDIISFNMDIWNNDALREICPGKFKIGKKHYEKTLLKAVELWGRGNAAVQFLAGPWESNESLLEGTKYFLDLGILVNITTFYPSPGSSFSKRPSKTINELASLYATYGRLLREYGFYPNMRDSILTSVSANRSSLSNEVARGYLTEDNYNNNELAILGGCKK